MRLTGGEFTVRDHGPGIADEDLPFVFDRFYRALSSRSAPGSGLGLAVVREIASVHGGMVAAEPAPRGGTVMRLTLPACGSAARQGSGASAVFVKKDQMTGAAPGMLPGGRGKECTPSFHTANASRLPLPHVVQVVRLNGARRGSRPAWPRIFRLVQRAISVVTGSGSRPLSPGL